MTLGLEALETASDVTIVGGGLVGASLACALTGHGVRTALVEPFPFDSDDPPGYDDRTIALAEGSRRILDGLGVWGDIAAHATPIRRIHVSDRGRFGTATLSAAEQGVTALGYVATARDIGRALTDRLAALPDVSLLMPASLDTLRDAAGGMHLTVNHDATLSGLDSRLVVAADGARSRVRELLDIGVRRWEYGQTAIVANITPEHAHEGVAYERFTATGPLALLPLSEGRCALVCTVRDEQVEALMSLDESGFADLVYGRFGARLGRIVRVGERQAHSLAYLRARVDTRPRVAVIGNAAHTLHPVAGQGFNLGLRDVAALAEVVVDAIRTGDDPGSDAVLLRYARWRRWDQARTAGFTDGLVRLFSNPLGPVGWLRGAGLVAFDLLPPAKRLLSRSAMGLTGRLPRLARGLSL
jgi:2-octaprenyl-6-methoxyphenol hydroxylase